jgi:hypothetical protein
MAYFPRPELSSRVLDGEVVVLDHDNEKIHQLNATASFVWTRLGGTLDLQAIADELTEQFDVSNHKALGDIRRIVRDFENLKLVMSGSEFDSRD